MDGPPSPEMRLAQAGAVHLGSKPRGKPFGRLRLLTLAEALSAPPRQYLLRGLLAPRELSVWWGAPKCGKSFLLLRIAFGLACARGLWGREPSRPVRFLYIVAEGEGGIGARLQALQEEFGDPGDAFRIIAQRTMLGPPGEDLADAIAAARHMRADVVVIDTLARTFGAGNEDAAQDMGAFVAACDQLREEAECHVAVVHHGSKDEAARTPRGSGALLGAADLVVKVKKGIGGAASTATVEHAKDDADGDELPFRLKVVQLQPGPDGNPRLTCLAEDVEEVGTSPSSLPTQTKRAMELLSDLILRSGNTLPSGPMFPPHADLRCVPFETWRDECRARTLSANGEKRAENRAFQRAAETLISVKKAATAEHNGIRLVWLAQGVGT